LNNSKDLNLIISQFENEAVYKNPGHAAVAAVEWLDEEYVVIARETLPVIKHPTLDDAFGGDTTARLTNITDLAFGGNYEKMRDLGLQYLVMADFIENKGKKEKEDKLKAERFEAYKTLFPNTGMTLQEFDFTSPSISQSNKNAIDAILLLKERLAKLELKR
jgi:hypothetical protein